MNKIDLWSSFARNSLSLSHIDAIGIQINECASYHRSTPHQIYIAHLHHHDTYCEACMLIPMLGVPAVPASEPVDTRLPQAYKLTSLPQAYKLTSLR
jgi:hypothetical protein